MQLRYFIYPAFLLICFLVFQSTKDYGYVTDYLGWLNRYSESSWSNVLNCFGYPGMHQFFHLVNFFLYKLIGKHVVVMGVVFILTHASVSYLVYRTFRLLLEIVGVEQAGLISLFAGIFTALSPYVVEPLSWDACYHYLMCTGLIFLSLRSILMYYSHKNKKDLYLHFVFFVLGLFTIELALVSPAIFLIYLSFVFWAKSDYSSLKKYWLQLAPTYLFLLASYFVLTRLTIGAWVGHYGAAQHLNFSPTLIIKTFSKYLAKLLFFTHFWKFSNKEYVYSKLSELSTSLAFIACILVLIIVVLKFSKFANLRKAFLASFLAFFFALLPVLNLFFVWLGYYENDRYSYFAAPHLYLFVSIFCVIVFQKYVGFGWVLVFICNAFFLNKMLHAVKGAGQVSNNLCQSFDFYDKKEVVLLCVPENINGAYLFRDYGDDGVTLNESLAWLGKGSYTGKMTNISEINLTSAVDSVRVELVEPTKIKVSIASWGSWFWRKGVGLTSFETERYKVTTGELSFQVEVKDTVQGRIFIYNKGANWEYLKLPNE